jgi:hypothetical protein
MSISPEPSPDAIPGRGGGDEPFALDPADTDAPPPAEPVASAWRFASENKTEFSLRAPVIALLRLTRGLGWDATTSSSSPPPKGLEPPKGLALSFWANRSAPAPPADACPADAILVGSASPNESAAPA